MPLLRFASALIAASLAFAFAGAVPSARAYITPDEFIGAGAGGGSSGGGASTSPAAQTQQPAAGTDSAGSGQADTVQVDGALVPLPAVQGRGGTMKETKETPHQSLRSGAGQANEQVVPVADRAAKVQERMARRLEQGGVPAVSEGIPLPALAPEPMHAAAPPEPPQSVREQIASNSLPPTGAAHMAILVVSALVAGGSFLFRRLAPKKI